MVELFIKLFDQPDQIDSKSVTVGRGYRIGDVVEVLEDGASWGSRDLVEPTGVILRVPGLSATEAREFLQADVDPNDKDNLVKGNVHRRINKVDFEKFSQSLKDALATRGKIAAVDYVDMTAADFRGYKTERDPVNVLGIFRPRPKACLVRLFWTKNSHPLSLGARL